MASSSVGDSQKFDDVFMGILQHCEKIEPFLEAIFSFLARRTDFFRLMKKKDDKYGFPPGVAEKMAFKIFRKYQDMILKEMGAQKTELSETLTYVETPPAAAKEKEVVYDSAICGTPLSNIAKEKDNVPRKDLGNSKSKTSVGNDCFNGSMTDNYSWSQTITDVDIKIPVPMCIKKSSNVAVALNSGSLSVAIKQKSPEDGELSSNVLLNGVLTHRIKCEESMWSLLPSDHIAINLEKTEQKWWTAVLVGEKEIERSSIDTTQSVSDFDEATQADIRKVMYDQEQKLMGKPTSDEQKTHNLLRQAWDAEGSPFKGTPFDPSKVNISGSGS